MKKKGFTLIELLAVIVILAIIALIATPLVLNVIDNAKKGAAVADAYVYVSEVEKYLVVAQMDSTKPQLQTGVSYQLSSKKHEVSGVEDSYGIFINDLVQINKDKPTSGYVIIKDNGKVEKSEMVISSYLVGCENDVCKIKGEYVEKEEKIVLVGNPILDKVKTLVYDDKGTCKTDGSTYNYMGGCYIKGSSVNNYVWYNGFMWRIMGINSDNTVRMITDENVTTLAYGPSDSGIKYKTNKGYINDWLNEYFYEHLNSTKSIIKEGSYFCSESITGNASRIKCSSGSEVMTKIGLISVDEYLLAGAKDSYLNINQVSWTMTPYSNSNVWNINLVGNVVNNDVTYMYGIRPVINVSPDATVTAGDGSVSTFYILETNKTDDIKGIISDKTTSGEYVLLEGKTYRIVSKDSIGVKLILDGLYEEMNGEIYETIYGYNNKFTLSSGIGKKLNNDVIKWLGLDNSDKVVKTIYYQGNEIEQGSSYFNTLKKNNGVEAEVGLIQTGDILAAQSSTMLTKNYTKTSSGDNSRYYWTMNKSSNLSNAWCIHGYSYAVTSDVSNVHGIRPVIVVRNHLNIIGGTGVWNNPYQV